ncbi:PD-(D/E)XK nuclease family protein [Fusobacterium hwasookii]|uniref:PDDEXK-like family protein n=1 Tax=Fusobacterium hwasookii TaxID=1583098 RepID=UPI00130E089F|nr:PD-(D/E)XK nuclease family protein [Fusobacterium hwasookii]QNE68548.1 PD-(D/E)XK nuclease family protein [Fusobacterium hwasookii]
MRNEYDEVNLHSKFIVELLKNKNYGKKFIEIFLEKLEIQVFNYENVYVFSEYSKGINGRIDILLEFSKGKEKKAIIIENKIYAEDQFGQLNRYYYSMINKNYSNDELEIVYLTLDGSEPDEESTKGLSKETKEKIVTISYKENIIGWIDDCIKEVAEVPIMRETLIQYKSLLKKITGKEDKKMIKEIEKLVLSNNEYLKMIYKIDYTLLREIKINLQFKFWEKLEEKLNEIAIKKKMKLENRLGYPNLHYSIDLIKNYPKKKFFGLMYFIKELENRGKLYLRIEIEEKVYYGFRIITNNGESNFNMLDDYLEKEFKELNFTRTNWWLGFKYISNFENISGSIDFKYFNENLAILLNNDEKLEKLVKHISEDIEDTLNYLKLS